MEHYIFYFLLITLTLNTLSAMLLKKAHKHVFNDKKWLAYVLITPPFGLIFGLILIIIYFIYLIYTLFSEYFKD